MKACIVFPDGMAELIDKVASAYGLTRSAFIRTVLKRELIRMGYLDMPLPVIADMPKSTPEGKKGVI